MRTQGKFYEDDFDTNHTYEEIVEELESIQTRPLPEVPVQRNQQYLTMHGVNSDTHCLDNTRHGASLEGVYLHYTSGSESAASHIVPRHALLSRENTNMTTTERPLGDASAVSASRPSAENRDNITMGKPLTEAEHKSRSPTCSQSRWWRCAAIVFGAIVIVAVIFIAVFKVFKSGK